MHIYVQVALFQTIFMKETLDVIQASVVGSQRRRIITMNDEVIDDDVFGKDPEGFCSENTCY